ncbi:hypothetical protein [Geodermatophilus sp. SYSU D00815]
MSTDALTTARPAPRTRALQGLALAGGILALLSWLIVGAWPMALVLGVPMLVAAGVAPRHPRGAAVLAGVPALAVAVWWVVYVAREGFAMTQPWQEVWFLVAGPVAAAAVVVAGLVAVAGDGNRFSRG